MLACTLVLFPGLVMYRLLWPKSAQPDYSDEKYDGRRGVEDCDLAFRLSQQGIKIHLLRSAEAIHYPHEKDKEKRKMEGYENCKYFNRKFSTMETQLYLDFYLDDKDFTDINQISMEMKSELSA